MDFRAGLLLLWSITVHSGGDVINDIYDLHIDKICKPNSPIASGRMSVETAWIFLIILYSASISIAILLLNYTCIIVSILGIIIGGVLYSHPRFRFKDHPVLSVTSIASYFALEAIGVWSAYAPITIDTLIVSFYVFVLLFSLTFFKDFKDVKGDINSLPLMLGVKKAAKVVSTLSLLPMLPMLYLLFLYEKTAIALAMVVYIPIAISAIYILVNDPVTQGHRLRNKVYLMIFIPSLVLFLMTFFF
ncbi:ubiquinone biosynthesis protein UbiA [Candidatus Altiarchaeales archaeon WOR_SM1_SCG]|nr:ubiquinone biosynthesis protein UbiA [Candidatus Altiarchaeales archaeon WOR_SM1_SCG]